MKLQAIPFTLIFPEWYDERAEFEHSAKGFLPGVEVKLVDGSRHKLYFYDTIRLGQDLEERARMGKPYLAEAGLVVVPEVSRVSIHKAVTGLWQEGFFQQLKPL